MNFMLVEAVRHYFPFRELMYAPWILWGFAAVIGIIICIAIAVITSLVMKRKIRRMEEKEKDNDTE